MKRFSFHLNVSSFIRLPFCRIVFGRFHCYYTVPTDLSYDRLSLMRSMASKTATTSSAFFFNLDKPKYSAQVRRREAISDFTE